MSKYQKLPISQALLPEPDIKLRRLSQKTRFRLQILARLTLQGIPDTEIAIQLGYNQTVSLAALRNTPEYKIIMHGLMHNTITELDIQLNENLKDVKAEIRNKIPEALRVFYDALQDKKPDIRMKAAEKLIDLDERLNKSKDGSQVNNFFIPDSDSKIADEIASAMSGAAAAKSVKIKP